MRRHRELDVHQPLDVERRGQLAGLPLDLLDDLGWQGVRRDDARRVAGVNAGLLDVLHDAADDGSRAVAEAIDIDLDGGLEELVDQDRLVLRHVGLDAGHVRARVRLSS